jgi:hypothetical protein
LKCGFDPTTVTIRDKPAWMALSTSDIPLPTNFPLAEDVLKNNAPFLGVKVSTFKISFKMTEELININPMFKPIQDTRFVVIYILLQNKFRHAVDY